MIGADILSFCDMGTRREFSLSSKDCWKLSQIPIANNDLVIDRQLAQYLVGYKPDFKHKLEPKAIINRKTDFRLYRNVKHLNINFIFSVSSSRIQRIDRQIEQRYYEQLNRLLSGSRIESIEYNLTYKYPQRVFAKRRLQIDANRFDYTECENGILLFLNKLKINYQNVKRLSVNPTVGGDSSNPRNVTLFEEDEFDEFVEYFPNLDTFIVQDFHDEGTASWMDVRYTVRESGIWSIFSKPYYWERLKRIELNLLSLIYDDTDIAIGLHPLFHIHKFKNLQKLKLGLSCDEECDAYYEQICNQHINAVCEDLSDISLTFGSEMSTETIDNIWDHILSFSPNMEDYTFLIERLEHRTREIPYHHLIGHTDNLKAMTVNNCDFFSLRSIINFISLRFLIIHCYRFDDELTEGFGEFKSAPNLQSFTCTLSIKELLGVMYGIITHADF